MASAALLRHSLSVCLVLFALRVHPEFPLVLAANRDEYLGRPTLPAAPWSDAPGIVAGRDGLGGGTWLGISRGRWAALTNYRDLQAPPPGAPSRGKLVVDYLQASAPPEAHLGALHASAPRYAGFSLLAGTSEQLWYYSNRERRVRRCDDGVHGLSNHLLDTPWPKVALGRARLAALLASPAASREALVSGALALLEDTAVAADAELPSTGLSLEGERALSAIRIVSSGYGSRTSSVVLADRAGTLYLTERTLAVGGQEPADRSFSIARAAATPV